jgi:hypothetical protein
MSYRAIGCLVVLSAIAGCSRQETVSCNSDTRYEAARSAPPVQIPDDLSPPNESDALRLPPPATVAGNSSAVAPCLQSPPSFFGDSRPFRRNADEPETSAESSAPATPAGDRVIDN